MLTTAETPVPGVVVVQPARGYRYSADPFLLLGVALEAGLPRRALDLGTGSGLIPLLLAGQGVDARGVDIQADWEPLWRESLARSGVRPTLEVLAVQDLPPASYDLVTCNPPYTPVGAGPVSPDPLKAAAHTELHGGLAAFVAAARRSVAVDGRIAFVVPRVREAELEGLLGDVGLTVRVGDRRSVLLTGPEVHRIRSLPARGPGIEALYARARGAS